MTPWPCRRSATGSSRGPSESSPSGGCTASQCRWASRTETRLLVRVLDARQVEVSRTLVFDAPRRARSFFEALIGDDLDIGRPASVEIIFGRQVATPPPPSAPPSTGPPSAPTPAAWSSTCSTSTPGSSTNLSDLQDKARAINKRILEAERAGQGTVLASPAFERIAHPSLTADGRRIPALRFGDPRVMALADALCATLLAATGSPTRASAP
jgi:hypothetical protein